MNLESKTEEGHTALWLALKNRGNCTGSSNNKLDEDSIATVLVKAGASTSAVSYLSVINKIALLLSKSRCSQTALNRTAGTESYSSPS